MSERSPGMKLLLVGLVALLLTIPLFMVYALVSDRESQSHTAQAAITAGWGGAQVVSGPVLVVPYTRLSTETETVDGQQRTRTVEVRDELYLSPLSHRATAKLTPERRGYSIYALGDLPGRARRHRALRAARRPRARSASSASGCCSTRPSCASASPTRAGCRPMPQVTAGGRKVELQPGKGLASSSATPGFYGFLGWNGEPLDVQYKLRPARQPQHRARPARRQHRVGRDLALAAPELRRQLPARRARRSRQGLHRQLRRPQPRARPGAGDDRRSRPAGAIRARPRPMRADAAIDRAGAAGGTRMAASIGLIEPVDLYSRVDRSVKYGFLFIGFTFLAFLMFDVVGGARVATAEYLLTGAGLVLFFVLLLAFAEVIGFTWAYVVASTAIIGLLTAYSAAVLKSRQPRAASSARCWSASTR